MPCVRLRVSRCSCWMVMRPWCRHHSGAGSAHLQDWADSGPCGWLQGLHTRVPVRLSVCRDTVCGGGLLAGAVCVCRPEAGHGLGPGVWLSAGRRGLCPQSLGLVRDGGEGSSLTCVHSAAPAPPRRTGEKAEAQDQKARLQRQ